MIDLEKKYLDIVRSILALRAPGCEVWAFGSRVRSTIQDQVRDVKPWHTKKYSDLDLAVVAREKLDWQQIEDLKLAISESDLPIMVDILDYNAVSDGFKAIIWQNHEVLMAGKK